jgi:predicted nucleic acid-binding Zn ribbon protein
MKKRKTPRVLGSLMSDVCRKIGMTEAYEEYKTLQLWDSVVGDAIARVTTVEKMKEGDLYVKVRNPSWRMELNFRKLDIVGRMNKAIGYDMIRNIIFK